jgi:hypothetical protein
MTKYEVVEDCKIIGHTFQICYVCKMPCIACRLFKVRVLPIVNNLYNLYICSHCYNKAQKTN